MSLILQLDTPLEEQEAREIIRSAAKESGVFSGLKVYDNGLPFGTFSRDGTAFSIGYNGDYGAYIAEYASRDADIRRITRDDGRVLEAKVIAAQCDFLMIRPDALVDIHRSDAWRAGMGTYAEAGEVLQAFGKALFRSGRAKINHIATLTLDRREMPEIYLVPR